MRLYRRDGVGTETLTSTRSATVEIAGREGLESAGHALAVGLSCLDGGSSGDDSSNSVGDLHVELGGVEAAAKDW